MARRKKHRKAPRAKTRSRTRKARRSRRKARHLKKSGRVRPVVIISGGSYHRPKRSKYFSRPTKINRRRRRHNPGRALSMGSVKSFFNARNLVHYLSIGGGIFMGTLLSRFLNTGMLPFSTAQTLPASFVATLAKGRPIHGLVHVFFGTMITRKSRNANVKAAGLGLAALGGFDFLTQLLTLAGMKGLPTFSGMDVSLLGMNYNTGRPTVLNGRPGAGIPSPFGGTSMSESIAEAMSG